MKIFHSKFYYVKITIRICGNNIQTVGNIAHIIALVLITST